ncbi:MAG: hypothetical protein Tsb009_37490 [Planctomycetaceae bacterium]
MNRQRPTSQSVAGLNHFDYPTGIAVRCNGSQEEILQQIQSLKELSSIEERQVDVWLHPACQHMAGRLEGLARVRKVFISPRADTQQQMSVNCSARIPVYGRYSIIYDMTDFISS